MKYHNQTNPKINPPNPLEGRILTLDLETDSLNWYLPPDNLIVSGVMRTQEGEFISLLCNHPESKLLPYQWVEFVQKFIDGHDYLLGANIKFDANFLVAAGINLDNIKFLDVTANEYRLSGQSIANPTLQHVATKYLGEGKLEGLDFKVRKASTYPADLLLKYNKQDVDITYRSFVKQWDLVQANNLERILYVDMAATKSLHRMEMLGFTLDTELCKEWQGTIRAKYEEAENNLLEALATPIPINLNSPDQLKAALFGGTLYVDGTETVESKLKPKNIYKLDVLKDRYIRCVQCKEVLDMGAFTDAEIYCSCNTTKLSLVKHGRGFAYTTNSEHEHFKYVERKAKIEHNISGLGFSTKNHPTTDGYRDKCRDAKRKGMPKPQPTLKDLSSDKDAMASLKPTTSAQKKFMDSWNLYNNLGTCLGSFLDKYPEAHVDGKLYTSFNTTRTSTGRLSSSGAYNAQQIPSRPAEGVPKIKKLFKPNDGYDYIVNFDYSGQEIVMLANLANDGLMIGELLSGLDMHRVNAAQLIYKIPEDDVTKDQRNNGKKLSFKISYGSTATGVANDPAMGMIKDEAQQAIDAWYAKYSGVHQAHDNWLMEGASPDRYGRYKITMPTGDYFCFLSGNQPTMMKNYPVQGASSTVTKVAAILVDQELYKKGYKSRVALTVHDSLVLMLVAEELWDVVDITKKAMTEGVHKFYKNYWGMDFHAPLSIEAEYGTTYAGDTPIYVGGKAKEGEKFVYRDLTYRAKCAINTINSRLDDTTLWEVVDDE